MKTIVWSPHAEVKLDLLFHHGFKLTKRDVEESFKKAIKTKEGYHSRKIAEAVLNERHLLRIVFEDHLNQFRIITLYPSRRSRYES